MLSLQRSRNLKIYERFSGLISAAFMIFNRIIGTGIFSTPSVILRSSGSVGLALLMWVIGAAVAAAGTSVYVELGTGLPRSGGEKTYMEYIYRKPKFLAPCAYASYAIFIGWASANGIAFGEYMLSALSLPLNWYNARLIGILCLAFTFTLHTFFPRTGIRLQNSLGFFKLVVLVGISVSGLFHVLGIRGFELQPGVEVPDNFRWNSLWEGTTSDANAIVTGLFSVMWAFVGYHNANYVLSEVRDPVRTIKLAAPLALASVTAVYLCVNLAYFAVVSKNDILGSGRTVAALFFGNLFGEGTRRVLSLIIACSTLGTVLVILFAYSRVIQDLGREGILPYSPIFASSKPFGSPLAGLATQTIVSSIIILASPPGDAYLFMLNMSSYSFVIFNTSISAGLLLLSTASFKSYQWNPPFRAYKSVVLAFFLSNLFLLFVPLVPPVRGSVVYQHLPYWLHSLVAFSVSFIGVCYWYVRFRLLPKRGGYILSRRWRMGDDGISRGEFVKTPKHEMS
ncbi:hypothetical protein JAAARDRAFT_125853 [Jaapia argillacea MUCL 33604]|uniref:Amino acid permease/ SLC12A domain-containing protein n=1 Tax=Jaapia argillacea MUCL 33604 TaxID=933084 RepID=A0A067Q2L1_9AGAM|nr:hypothetical protein JAAARDRAFT_125853 [Jaapia argillacea MUCL 33604]